MRPLDFASLLERPESESLDFKATCYDLSDRRQKRNFAKDLASLINTPRGGDAHIVLGVKKRLDGSTDLVGLDREIDDADLQDVAQSLLEPNPRFLFSTVTYRGVTLGLISIPAGNPRPVVPAKTLDNGFVGGSVYFRRGSKNDVASTQEQIRIWDWFRNSRQDVVSANPYALDPAWPRYMAAVAAFHSTSRQILIVDDAFREDANDLSGIGAGPWTYVLDFDMRSDVDGLLAVLRPTVEQNRALHVRVKGDPRTSRSPEVTTTWFFVRGLHGRAESISAKGVRSWRRDYRQVLSEEFDALAGELSPTTVHVTILWRDGELNPYLAEVLRTLDDSLRDFLSPVFVTDAPGTCQSLAEEFDAPVIEMPLHQFARGVQQVADEKRPISPGSVTLPSASGVPIELDPKTANWIAEEIELVPLGDPESDDNGIVTFLRGGLVTWADLDREVDARRDIQTRLTAAIRKDLDDGRTTRVNLFHRPGTGGTTVGRRVAWELHEDFPCGLLRRTAPMDTADRVARLYEETGSSVLLIADGTDIAERELDDLAEYFRARRTPVVLLQVRRRQASVDQQRERTFDLSSVLSPREAGRFVHKLSIDAPDRAEVLKQLERRNNRTFHRPVYFALTAYEQDFRGLSDFVSSRISKLTDSQSEALVYAAIALRYGQGTLPVSALRTVFGLSPRDSSEVPRLFPPTTDELFVEIASGEWRIGHSLVADELLRQMLSTGGDPRTWRNPLADWGIRFITFCRGDLPIPSDELLEMARRVFVYREDLDVLGREQSFQQRFAQFIEDIPVSEGRLRVLNALVEEYPEESHFWAHLARFHAMDREDFAMALQASERAVELSDRDSVVYHMRGMVRRYQLRQLRQREASVQDLVAVAMEASADFQESRTLNPENEHGYIAEAQMLIELLDHIARSFGDLFQFISGRGIPPYLREALDRVETLLAHVKRERAGVGASQYETRASARLHELYGDYASAIQRLNSLTYAKRCLPTRRCEGSSLGRI